MKQVLFKCNTCDYRNSQHRGEPGYDAVWVEFRSLTDAYQHLFDTVGDGVHDIEAYVEEDIET